MQRCVLYNGQAELVLPTALFTNMTVTCLSVYCKTTFSRLHGTQILAMAIHEHVNNNPSIVSFRWKPHKPGFEQENSFLSWIINNTHLEISYSKYHERRSFWVMRKIWEMAPPNKCDLRSQVVRVLDCESSGFSGHGFESSPWRHKSSISIKFLTT